MSENIPNWMKLGSAPKAPVWFLDIRGQSLDLADPTALKRINERLREMLEAASPKKLKAPALIKTHIGEPKAWQRIIPELTRSSIDFLRNRGVDKIATGDTTVLYSRGRGGRENPPNDISPYMNLAKDHGWLDLGIPFVVLDRPISSVKGVLEFFEESVEEPTEPPNRFKHVYPAGALPKIGSIINHAHLTGHPLTELALSIKGVSMGLSDRRGKARMHMAFQPVFADNLCDRCGMCATECPEKALEYPDDAPPKLDEEKCIGCGQCLSECPSGAIEIKPRPIKNWARGAETIQPRLADCFIGLMRGRWDKFVHVGHLVRITGGCDCLNMDQKQISPDIGFLVGVNPFALDKAAELLLEESAPESAEARELIEQARGDDIYKYVEKTHGIITAPDIKSIQW